MPNSQVRILVVEEDPDTRDQIEQQILKPLDYQVHTTPTATEGIAQAVEINPDVIITNINLSGLSGKDLLVALSSQGVDAPVILLAEEGMEQEAIRAFRLGAVDYLNLPIKETELISAVERVLKTEQKPAPEVKDHQDVSQKVAYLEERIMDLTKVVSIAKKLTSTSNPEDIFRRIVDSAVYMSGADRGWLMLREYHTHKYRLRYYNNLPDSLESVIGQPWDDGISSLVNEAEKTLHLEKIKSEKSELAKLGKVILGVPIIVRGNILGTIILVKVDPEPFRKSTQKLIETISEFAAIALLNSGYFEIKKT